MKWRTQVERDISWTDLENEQSKAVLRARARVPEATLLISEPRPTYTFGRFAKEDGLLISSEELSRRGIEVHRAARGGQWTYHGPGQVLAYPIAPLKELGLSRHAVFHFVKALSKATRDLITAHGIESEERAKPFGIYVQNRKLASFGLAFDQGISTHGVALYHSPQLEPFRGINPCGCPGQENVSLTDLCWRLDWNATAECLADSIKKGFIPL